MAKPAAPVSPAVSAKTASPARDMQERLASSLGPSPRSRPAPVATLLYIVVFTAGFWSLVAVGLRTLIG